MRKFLSLIMCVMFIFMCAATGAYANKIEQVYSKLPEVKVYMPANEQLAGGNVNAYLNSDELSFVNKAPFNLDDGVSYVFMIDCSASVKKAQIDAVKSTITNFIWSARPNDKFTIVSFGENVNILSNGSTGNEDAINAVNSIVNNHKTTVLFDAVNSVRDIVDKQDQSFPKKKMCVIFTDAANDNLGGTTGNEVMDVAEKCGVPIYAVAINEKDKSSIDTLGEVARASGGEVFVAKKGDISAAFSEAVATLGNLYEISFSAPNNKTVPGTNVLTVYLGDKSAGDAVVREFMSTAWTVDNTPPQFKEAVVLGDKELLIKFSENVENAGKTESYKVKKGAESLKVKSANYNKEDFSVTLSFEDYLGAGNYEIHASGITDDSMEKNKIEKSHSFSITGLRAELLNMRNSAKGSGGWFIAIIVLVIAMIVAYAIIKKRKGLMVVDGKTVFGDNVSYEHKLKGANLPSKHLALSVEDANGSVTNLDINIVQSVIFGRSESCEVTISDNSLSRQHFAIELEDGDMYIQNLSSTNGTLLNGVGLMAKRKLCVGDVIIAGQERFTVRKI